MNRYNHITTKVTRKQGFLVALVALCGFGCTGEERYIGDKTATQVRQITLAGSRMNVTRAATGADAAALLDNEFVVYGTMTSASDKEFCVFDNYRVHYNGEASRGTDDTNIEGWSYLSDGTSPLTSIGANPLTQSTQFWDVTAKRYDFIAFSGVNHTSAYQPSRDYIKSLDGFQVRLTADDMGKTYVSNHKVITSDYENQVVLLTFYRMQSRLRVGFYEAVPGYAVSNVRFYYGDTYLSGNPADAKVAPGLQATVAQKGEYTITYDAAGLPQAALDVATANIAKTLSFDKLQLFNASTTAVGYDYLDASGRPVTAADAQTADQAYLSETAAAPSWARLNANPDEWVNVYPYANKSLALPAKTGDKQPGCENNLVLRVDLELVPLDGSASTIKIYNASAVVPAAWAQWKANCAYTYIFKITEEVNGSTTRPEVNPETGNVEDPNVENPDTTEALFPIVFDAETSSIEEYSEEYITGVTPLGSNAITTYCPGSNVLNAQEYAEGEEIQLSAPAKGQWRLTWIESVSADDLYTEDAASRYFETWYAAHPEVLGGMPDPSDSAQTIHTVGVYGASFKASHGPGWYVVELRYLPAGRSDEEANYLNVYKVIRFRPAA